MIMEVQQDATECCSHEEFLSNMKENTVLTKDPNIWF